MSDTTGWEKPQGHGGYYVKRIDTRRFAIDRFAFGWYLSFGDETIARRATLRKCQILAHETARLWAGETE